MKFAFFLLRKQKWMSFLISAQICVTLIFSVVFFSVMEKSYLYYRMTEPLDETYLYVPEDPNKAYEDGSPLSESADAAEIDVIRVGTASIAAYDKNLPNALAAIANAPYQIDKVYPCESLIAKSVRKQPIRGRWFSDDVTDGVIECVIAGDTDDFPIGSILDGARYSVSYAEGTGVSVTLDQTYRFRVVGVGRNDMQAMPISASTYPISATQISDFFEDAAAQKPNALEKLDLTRTSVASADRKKDSVTIFCSMQALYPETDVRDKLPGFRGNNALISFRKDLAESRKNEILQKLHQSAGVCGVAQLRENDLLTLRNTMAENLPILICFVVMAFTSSVCMGFLNIRKNEKNFRVFHICGITARQSALLLGLYALLLFALAALLLIPTVLFAAVSGMIPWYFMRIGLPTVLCGCAVAFLNVLILFLSEFFAFRALKKEMSL